MLWRVLLGLPLGLHGPCELDPHVHGAVSIPYEALHWQMDPGTSALMTEPRMVRMACSSSVYKNSFSVSRFHQGKTNVVG